MEDIHFQNSILSLAEMTLSNYVNIKYFLIIHGIGQAVIHIMCDSNENAKLIVPWAFSFPLSTVKAQAESPDTFPE